MVFASPLTKAWNEATVSWNAPWANGGGDIGDFNVPMLRAGDGWHDFDITALVSRIAKGTAVNNGFILYSDNFERTVYASSQMPGDSAQFRPKLVLSYALGDDGAPSVQLTAPLGGSMHRPSEACTITWNAEDNVGIASTTVRTSANDGLTWTVLDSMQGNPGSLLWHMPRHTTDDFKVRVDVYDDFGNTAGDMTGRFASMPDTSGMSTYDLLTDGSWEGLANGAGTTSTLKEYTGGKRVDFVLKTGVSPWVQLSGTREDSHSLDSVRWIRVDYRASKAGFLTIEQPDLSEDGESWQATLYPSSRMRTQWLEVDRNADFTQPDWVETPRPFAPGAANSIAITPDMIRGSSFVELTALSFYGADQETPIAATASLGTPTLQLSKANGVLHLSSNTAETGTVAKLFSVDGRCIRDFIGTGDMRGMRCDISGLAAGAYLVQIKGPLFSQTLKAHLP